MKSMEEMLKAAQEAAQTIQKQMEEAQVTLDKIEVEGVSGGGLVKVRASAKGRIQRCAGKGRHREQCRNGQDDQRLALARRFQTALLIGLFCTVYYSNMPQYR